MWAKVVSSFSSHVFRGIPAESAYDNEITFTESSPGNENLPLYNSSTLTFDHDTAYISLLLANLWLD